ncbi:techylectin-5A-like isoform X2 [Asterias rubens]|uniref:techylectin-5A-like isoform X2 n=1 Tax=Asterias rubens TaxID=7604 RepID=UPI0014550CE8|nr:techylectin-5A-like isoform X2 [Asterias rubens]
MGPFVFLVLVMTVKSAESVESDDPSPTFSENSVCQQQVITINPLVYSQSSPPLNSEIGCNSSTIQHMVETEQMVTRRQLEELQIAVSTNQKMITSALRNATHQFKDTTLQVQELLVSLSGFQENVTSEVLGIRRQLEQLQVLVSAFKEFLHDSSTMNQASTTDATERTTTTETDSSTMNQASTTDATERITTKETGSSTMNQASTTDATERTTTTETDAPPKDCSDILASGVSISGVYTVQPLSSGEAFQVYCDMETDGGGWTVFQRREDGSVDFYLDFASYSRGFGNLEGEFWLGNDNLHRLTAQGEYELRVDLSDFESESRFAKYDSFSIADVSGIYKLAVGSYSGTAGDSLSVQNNQPFSTKDRDNDAWYRSCAQTYHGAWWYRDCHFSNLNGEYLRGTTTVYARGAVWRTWRGYRYSLRTSEMKIRPTPQQ